MIRPLPRTWQKEIFNNFKGGMACVPQTPAEALVVRNMQVTKEGFLRGFNGTTTFTSTDLEEEVFGLGVGIVGEARELCYLAITDAGKAWSILGLEGPESPFGAVDVTGFPDLNGNLPYWSFAQGIEDNIPVILFCNQSNGLFLYDGTGVISGVVGGPTAPILVATYKNYTVLVEHPNTLYFSEPNDPRTWPVDTIIELTMEQGPVTGLAALPDKLIVFFKDGTATISGDGGDEFLFDVVMQAGSLGTNHPMSVSVCNNEVGFLTSSGPVIVDATGAQTDFISEPIREIFQDWDDHGSVDPDASVTRYTYHGSLSELHFIISRIDVSTPADTRTYIFDRLTRTWWEMRPDEDKFQPTTWCKRTENVRIAPRNTFSSILEDGSDYEGLLPGVFYAIPPNVVEMYGAQQGGLYVMNMATHNNAPPNVNNDETPFWVWDESDKPVSGVWRSKWIDFGSEAIQKQLGQLKLDGWGKDVTITLHWRQRDGSETSTSSTYSFLQGATTSTITPGGWNSKNIFRSLSIEIEGKDLDLRQVALTWRPMRIG